MSGHKCHNAVNWMSRKKGRHPSSGLSPKGLQPVFY